MAEGNEIILDAYSALNHKSTMQGSQRVTPDSGMAPTWIGPENRRRLNAYITLQGYLSNVARYWLMSTDRELRREYGDSELIRDIIRGAVLGDGFGFRVFGSEWDAPPEPESGDTIEEQHYEEELTHWQAVVRQQHWFERWASVEQIDQKIIQNENNTIGLGDGVLVLSWSNAKNRVRVRTYDPGFYFPVYGDSEDDYPSRVHLAWEFEELNPSSGNMERYVRRITYELIDDGEFRTYPYPSTADSLELEDPNNIHAQTGHAAGHTAVDAMAESQSTQVCLMSDGVWKVADITSGMSIDDLADSNAVWQENADGEELFEYDLGIDFIPVIHFPNTIDLADHFGQSALLRVAQLLDDLHAADSDLASASALVGTPPMMISGWEGQDKLTTYGPGALFGVGAGDMKILDTSKSLDALTEHVSRLLNRISVNRQIPDAIFGRIDASDVPSGVALLLSFGPFRQYIEELRLAREEKYCLLHKMVQRLGRVGGQLDGVYPGCMTFGSYLPNDLASVVDTVTKLVQGDKPVLSKATALRLLSEAGLEIQDVDIELQRVRSEDFRGAALLADATAAEDNAREYLGIVEESESGDGEPPEPIPEEDLPT